MIVEFFVGLKDFIFNIIIEIVSFILYGLLFIIDLLFFWINVPPIPAEFASSLNSFLDLIFNNLSIIGFFVPGGLVKVCIPLLIILINFELFYKMFMWVIRKIPFLSVK